MGPHIKRPAVPAQQSLDHLRRIVQSLRTPPSRLQGQRLSGAQLLVLQQLRTHGPATMNELSTRTLTHQSSVSVVVTRLEEGGWVRRETDEADRRQVRVALTATGTRLAKRSLPLPHAALRDALTALPERDQQSLARLLGRVVTLMKLPSGPPPMFFEEASR